MNTIFIHFIFYTIPRDTFSAEIACFFRSFIKNLSYVVKLLIILCYNEIQILNFGICPEDKLLKQLLQLKKIAGSACVFYSFFITALYLLGAYVDSNWIPTLHMVFSLLLFSFVLAAANAFLFSDRLVFSLRLLIHYGITTFVFYIVFVLWGGFQANGGSVLTALLLYTFVYLIGALFIFMYRYITAENRTAKKEYKASFDGQDSYRPQFDKKK